MLEINVDVSGANTVCRPVGELDAFTVAQFREALADIGGPTRLLIDLSGVPFLDSAGLGALIGAQRRLRELDSELRLTRVPAHVEKILHITALDQALPIHSVEDDDDDDL